MLAHHPDRCDPPPTVGARMIEQRSTSPSVPRPGQHWPGTAPLPPTTPPSVFLWEILWLRALNTLFTLAPPQKEADGGRRRGQREMAEKRSKSLVYASVWLRNYRQTARGVNRKTWSDKTRHQAQFAQAHSAERCLTGGIWGAGEPINTSCAPLVCEGAA